ncbi:calcium-binding protein [Szabonella alba]|uniref:Ca2+-binding protein, RTX toxin-related n=1 Tax=Szabonella alba TaxID=2804194 RepID=A0A8K0VHN5_9RHOB|nr:hypothetical protein [Szabonella alba]MBL4919390.1 hypothetical protein [Szabonella alba]
MTTFTLSGITVQYNANFDPVSVGTATFEAVFPNNQAFINYTVLQTFPGELPIVDIGGTEPISARINGSAINPNADDMLGAVTTNQGATYILLGFFDPATNRDYLFQIGGPALPPLTTLQQFINFGNSIASISTVGGAFAPGQNIAVSSFLNVDIDDGPVGQNVINGTNGDDNLIGTAADDLIITGNSTPNGDYVAGSAGNDTIDMSGNDGINGFVLIDYFNQPSVNVTLNGATNTGSVTKGANGTDTLIGVANPLNAGNFEGGLEILGTAGNDTFNLTLANDQWMSIRGGAGQDSYVINGGGAVRLDFRSSTGGINVNLATGQILNDGFGNFETITGTGNVWEVQTSLANDTITGSNANESFRFLGGNNTINGGGGFDRLRYDHGTVSSVNADLAAGTASIAMTNGNNFTDSLTSIEFLRGSNGNDILRGDGADNRLEGRNGDDVLISVGGNDTLIGGSGADRFVLAGTGNVSIADFQIGTDVLDLRQVPLSAAAISAAFANSTQGGGGTTVNLGAAGSLFLNGLTKAQALQITPVTPVPTTPVLMELFRGNDSFYFAFFNTLTNDVQLDVQSWTTTQIVLRNPSNGAVTTITGTGFPAGGEQENPPGLVTSWETRDAGGAVVIRLSGMNWPLAEMFAAITEAFEDDNEQRLDALFDLQPLITNAAAATMGVELHADMLTKPVFFTGSAFNDTLEGGDGNDTMRGENGNDLIYGGLGNDDLAGGAGNDQIFGVAGSNIIWGGVGNDTVQGGTGSDTIHGGGSGTNQLFGNNGNDLIYAGSGGDFIGGGAGNDTIRGGDGADTIYGGLGNDDLAGGAGNDQIFGSAGSNIIWGGLGNDTVQGGTGSDTIHGGGSGTNQLFGNEGNDLIYAGSGGDFIGGGAGNDTLRGAAGADTIRGDDGNDVIYGGLGNDDLAGGAGNDAIFGDAGSNIIWGGLGNDTVQGGTGNDTVYGGGSGTNQLFGNDGNDLIFAGNGGDLIGGGAGNDIIRGGNGADTIYGGLGNDDLAGGAGNDVIFGSAGNNIIWGGLGNDTIHGGTGKDSINGGPGADTFVFASAAHIGIGGGRDVITGFASGEDQIDLTALNTTFNGTGGVLGGGQASFYYAAAAGLLIGDQNGDGAADWVLELTGAPGVTAGDFLL